MCIYQEEENNSSESSFYKEENNVKINKKTPLTMTNTYLNVAKSDSSILPNGIYKVEENTENIESSINMCNKDESDLSSQDFKGFCKILKLSNAKYISEVDIKKLEQR